MSKAEPAATCHDCKAPYPFGLDMVLSDRQWLMIFPEGDGLLCPTCICKRAEKLDGAIRVDARIMGSLMVPREPFEIDFHLSDTEPRRIK